MVEEAEGRYEDESHVSTFPDFIYDVNIIKAKELAELIEVQFNKVNLQHFQWSGMAHLRMVMQS
jgi:hypothetical protein